MTILVFISLHIKAKATFISHFKGGFSDYKNQPELGF